MSKPLLKPVTTRSALLTMMLAAEESSLPTRELIGGAGLIGFAEPTVRVALSRMAAAGDVLRHDDGSYSLSERLLARQRRQDEAVHPRTRAWRGPWEMVVVTATGRSAAERAELRSLLAGLRLAELREGVWTRPANLKLDWPAELDQVATRFTGRPEEEPAALASRLWDLDAWADRANELLAAAQTADPKLRFTACAIAGRHLLDDPVLPDELLPADWPGAALREAHLASRAWLAEMRHSLAAQTA